MVQIGSEFVARLNALWQVEHKSEQKVLFSVCQTAFRYCLQSCYNCSIDNGYDYTLKDHDLVNNQSVTTITQVKLLVIKTVLPPTFYWVSG